MRRRTSPRGGRVLGAIEYREVTALEITLSPRRLSKGYRCTASARAPHRAGEVDVR
ncbi:hypothetical protein ACIRG5_24780 [Lentzea sp. NPDC102401]|uniref:hypothetical protein n=1 Tax=Lentzea sp. NPDC102401 TaxID=3364128 RepID=UPI00381367F6